MQVQLEGITQKGKNRIREHGDIWQVVGGVSEHYTSTGGRKLYKAINSPVNKEYLKWGPEPDFKIVREMPS